MIQPASSSPASQRWVDIALLLALLHVTVFVSEHSVDAGLGLVSEQDTMLDMVLDGNHTCEGDQHAVGRTGHFHLRPRGRHRAQVAARVAAHGHAGPMVRLRGRRKTHVAPHESSHDARMNHCLCGPHLHSTPSNYQMSKDSWPYTLPICSTIVTTD